MISLRQSYFFLTSYTNVHVSAEEKWENYSIPGDSLCLGAFEYLLPLKCKMLVVKNKVL